MNRWIEAIFKAKIAKRGGIVRRSRASVLKNASVRELRIAVKRRGFHLIRSGGQYVIICSGGEIKVLC